MFKDKYTAIYDQVKPDEKLLADTLSMSRTTRKQRNPFGRIVALPVGAVASLLIVFTLMVNLSPAFAQGIEQLPLLGRLGEVVSFSPSLRDAVENDFVQIIGQEEIVNGVTVRIEYVIVDQRQIHVFYTVQSEQYENLWISDFKLMDGDSIPLEEYFVAHLQPNHRFWEENFSQEDLRYVEFTFVDVDVPESLVIAGNIFDGQESGYARDEIASTNFASIYSVLPIQAFSIPLSLDPTLIRQSEVITVNQEFIIDGQSLTITTIDIMPTQTRVNIIENEENSAWLKALSLHLIDENDMYFGAPFDGVSKVGCHCSDIRFISLETVFFANSKHLTLVVTDAVWLDKDAEPTKIDLVNSVAENLPLDVELIQTININDEWLMTFLAPFEDKFYDECSNSSGHAYEIFDTEFYDGSGNKQMFAMRWMSFGEHYAEAPGHFGISLILTEYAYDVVYLIPAFTHRSMLEVPIEIIVR